VDSTTARIARYVHTADYASADHGAVERAKVHLLDGLGCAVGGYDGGPARIAARLAEGITVGRGASVFGSGAVSSLEHSTFANTTMLRLLDYNDAMILAGGCHPSDVIPALIAAGQYARRPGKELVAGILQAYETLGSILSEVSIRSLGWDQGSVLAIAVAAAASKLLGATEEQTGEAISIAAVSSISARQTRAGQLSNWKGCATASSAKNGVFAAQLAVAGITGPTAAFEGHAGFFEQVTGPLEIRLPLSEQHAMQLVHLKYYPAEYHAQALLGMLSKLRQQFDLADLASVQVETYELAIEEIADTPARWAPGSRETADHSMPYLAAVMLTDGRVDLDSFGPEKYQSAALLELMSRITVVADEQMTKDFPDRFACRVSCMLSSGEKLTDEVNYGKGHARNPMSAAEVREKFERMAGNHMSRRQTAYVCELVDRLEDLADVTDLATAMTFDRQ
jgi:2-methylcitrate dehydratase